MGEWGREEVHTGFRWGNIRERDHLEDPGQHRIENYHLVSEEFVTLIPQLLMLVRRGLFCKNYLRISNDLVLVLVPSTRTYE
jgi:hypothetical protein